MNDFKEGDKVIVTDLMVGDLFYGVELGDIATVTKAEGIILMVKLERDEKYAPMYDSQIKHFEEEVQEEAQEEIQEEIQEEAQEEIQEEVQEEIQEEVQTKKLLAIGNNKKLSKQLQKVLFKKGWAWIGSGKEVINTHTHFIVFDFEFKQLSLRSKSGYPHVDLSEILMEAVHV